MKTKLKNSDIVVCWSCRTGGESFLLNPMLIDGMCLLEKFDEKHLPWEFFVNDYPEYARQHLIDLVKKEELGKARNFRVLHSYYEFRKFRVCALTGAYETAIARANSLKEHIDYLLGTLI